MRVNSRREEIYICALGSTIEREPNLFQFLYPLIRSHLQTLDYSIKSSNLHRNNFQIMKNSSLMAGFLKWAKNAVKQAPSPPRQYSNVKFPLINPSEKVEEEKLGIGRYYPTRIGDVLSSRYQIVGKLGFGNSSTVWLARDLQSVMLSIPKHKMKLISSKSPQSRCR